MEVFPAWGEGTKNKQDIWELELELGHRASSKLQSKLRTVSGLPREAEKVSATVAGRLREYVNTEFVWARVQTGFVKAARK